MSESIWEKITAPLDDDQMMVRPETYIKNREMFDKIYKVVDVVKDKDNYDVVWGRYTDKWLEDNEDSRIVARFLIVRLIMPWDRGHDEWWISGHELTDNLQIQEVRYRVRCLPPTKNQDDRRRPRLAMVSRDELHYFPGEYEILEKRYLVCLKPKPLVNPDSVTKMLAQ